MSVCIQCSKGSAPVEYLSDERKSEGHVAVRFMKRGVHGTYRVVVDGVDVTSNCCEALAGDTGWAVVFSVNKAGTRFACFPEFEHVATELLRGRVEVVPS